METIPGWLHAHAQVQPDRIALAAPSREGLSYRSLQGQVTALVGRFEKTGIPRGARVGVVLPSSAEAMVALLAAMSHGACAPLNPGLTEHEFEFECEDLGIVAIVVEQGQNTAAIPVATRRGIQVITLPPPGAPAGPLARPAGEPPLAEVPSDQIALVLHTSGTTARPKIVPLTHEMLARSAASVVDALALVPGDRYLSVMPLYHIHGLATLFGAIAAGCTIIAPRGFDPSQFWTIVESCDPTWYSSAPTIHQGILRTTAGLARVPSTRLRLVRSASAALSVSTIEELERVFHVPVIEFYGMTEASDQITTNPLPPGIRKPGAVGRPVAGMELAIADPSGDFVSGQGSGEILIRGKAVIPGYENNPAADAASFRDGWFRTGDLGHRDADGYLYLTGRAKEIINRGGEKISPREVDEVVMRHPAVHQAVTFALPHPTLGEAVGIAVVLKPGVTALPEDIREFAARYLVDFKIPQEVVFTDSLPKGATGKLQRIGLAQHFAPVLARRAGTELRGESLPTTPTEQRLAALWKEQLRVDQVSVRDNFFALGGDSLIATIVVSRMSEQLEVALPSTLLFQKPVLSELAVLVDQLVMVPAGDPRSAAIHHRSEPLGRFAASHVQARLWLIQQLGGRSNVVEEVRIGGNLDRAGLERAWASVVARHAALQTTFVLEGERVMQDVRRRPTATLEHVDLRGHAPGEREAQYERVVAEASRRPFDLSAWPPFAGTLVRFDTEEHALVLALPHILVDRWSVAVLFRDLAACCGASGMDPDLPALRIDYVDYALWQHQVLSPAELAPRIAYWKRTLAGAPESLQLWTAPAVETPARGARGEVATGQVAIRLDEGLVRGLRALAAGQAATFYHVVLAGFMTLLHRYSEAVDLVVGTSIDNRIHEAAWPVIGCFMDHLPIRARFRDSSSFNELVAEVRNAATGALSHAVPFDVLLTEVQSTRHAAHDPFFQVTFNVLIGRDPPPSMLGGCRLHGRRSALEIDRLYLNLTLRDDGDVVAGALEYSAKHFDRAAAEQLAAHYVLLLEGAVAAPNEPVGELPMVRAGGAALAPL